MRWLPNSNGLVITGGVTAALLWTVYLIYHKQKVTNRILNNWSSNVPKDSNSFVKKQMLDLTNQIANDLSRKLPKYRNSFVKKQMPDLRSKNGDVQVPIYHYDGSQWTINSNICSGLESKKDHRNFKKVLLKTPLGNLPIYIHDPKYDYISKTIWKTKNFEPTIFKALKIMLDVDPKMSFLDIGANIGVYSLQVAKYGRHVLAMEVMEENVQHLCAGAEEGHVSNRITIINNAMGSNHEPVKIARMDRGGFGAIFVDGNDGMKDQKRRANGNVFNQYDIFKTVMLDDFLDLPNIDDFRNVLVKMDVEGWEHQVLEGAKMFFRRVHVHAVFMEFRWHIKRPTRKIIEDFFAGSGFEPYTCTHGDIELLDPKTMREHDVLWLPRDQDNIKIAIRDKLCVDQDWKVKFV